MSSSERPSAACGRHPARRCFASSTIAVVWVLADVAERDIALDLAGSSRSSCGRASYPDRPFKGQVALVYPHLNMETRTARVRIELPNPDGLLLGDMFADVEIEAGGRQKVLAVPESAVIDTGKRQVVILDKGEGRFQPREVKIGRRGEGFAEIHEGRRRRRPRRDLRDFPHRRREQSEGGVAGAGAAEAGK